MENVKQCTQESVSEMSITPEELLIYACIKKYMLKYTRQAFPSLKIICADSGASRPTVLKYIKNLAEAGFITILKKGKRNIYVFPKEKELGPFSYDLLSNKNISFLEKTALLTEQYLSKDQESDLKEIGKILESHQERLFNQQEKSEKLLKEIQLLKNTLEDFED